LAEGYFELPPVGPYSFGASVRSLEGFAPAAYEGRRSGRLRMAYGLDAPPSAEELERLGRSWRPYRTWVSLHLRAMLEDEIGEIGR
jgi:DNA-3-methyladenine glycosylase II